MKVNHNRSKMPNQKAVLVYDYGDSLGKFLGLWNPKSRSGEPSLHVFPVAGKDTPAVVLSYLSGLDLADLEDMDDYERQPENMLSVSESWLITAEQFVQDLWEVVARTAQQPNPAILVPGQESEPVKLHLSRFAMAAEQVFDLGFCTPKMYRRLKGENDSRVFRYPNPQTHDVLEKERKLDYLLNPDVAYLFGFIAMNWVVRFEDTTVELREWNMFRIACQLIK